MNLVPRFCAYCNRSVGDDGIAVGMPIPKELQKGTHTTCRDCLPVANQQVASAGSFGDFMARKMAEKAAAKKALKKRK